ncbi:hypothetical protein [Kitasatospora aureofaciens]
MTREAYNGTNEYLRLFDEPNCKQSAVPPFEQPPLLVSPGTPGQLT